MGEGSEEIPVIEVSGLTVRRGTTTILDGVDWRVMRGENWVIMGANGCGKTSLLGALTGYMTPTSGTVSVFGRRFGRTDWRELRKAIGTVSSAVRQRVDDGETAMEVVASGKDAVINLWKEPEAAVVERAERLLGEIECAGLRDRAWLYLSQGERQRVLIGRALMADPPLLILDEPCAGLDPVAREKFLGFLGRLAGGDAAPTLVLVTHHVEEITGVFNRVMLLRGGRVSVSGEKGEVLTGAALGAAFGAEVELRMDGRGGYRMEVKGGSDLVL